MAVGSVMGAGSGFGRPTTLDLARLGHRIIAGVQTWPQAWQPQQNTAAGVESQVIKLDLRMRCKTRVAKPLSGR